MRIANFAPTTQRKWLLEENLVTFLCADLCISRHKLTHLDVVFFFFANVDQAHFSLQPNFCWHQAQVLSFFSQNSLWEKSLSNDTHFHFGEDVGETLIERRSDQSVERVKCAGDVKLQIDCVRRVALLNRLVRFLSASLSNLVHYFGTRSGASVPLCI